MLVKPLDGAPSVDGAAAALKRLDSGSSQPQSDKSHSKEKPKSSPPN